MAEQDIIFKAEANVLLGRLAIEVQFDKALVNLIRARRHLLHIVHVVPLPVAERVVRAGLALVRVVLPDDHLRHFVYKEGLPSREQAENGCSVHSLPFEVLSQIHLLANHRL